jgi:DNA polymerase I
VIISSHDDFKDFCRELSTQNIVFFDAETTGLKPWDGDRQCGVGFCFSDERTFYIPFRHINDPFLNIPLKYMPDLWQALSQVDYLVGHNIKFDLAVLYQDGFEPIASQVVGDTMVAARLCNKDKYASLSLTNQISKVFGGQHAQYESDLIFYLKKYKLYPRYDKAPVDILGPYCESDVLWTKRLLEKYEPVINRTDQNRIWSQEQEITRCLWEKEKVGVAIDRKYGEEKLPILREVSASITQDIYDIAGYKFDVNSTKQLKEVMGNLGLRSRFKTPKKREDSWNVKALEACDHPIATKILNQRKVAGHISKFFEPYLRWKGDIHPQFKNWGTIHGRLSCEQPNLQQVSRKRQEIEDSEDIWVRRLFVPRPGYLLYMFDYAGQEMRILADYVQDEELTLLCQDRHFDFHGYVAKEIWGVDEHHADWDMYRTIAKSINFGLVYGMGAPGLALAINRTKKEAERYRTMYFDRWPKVQSFIRAVSNTVASGKSISNRFGRRYWLPQDKGYIGVEYLVSGTGADIIKACMIRIRDYLLENKLKSRMIIQVHDELIFELAYDEAPWLPQKIQEIMQEKYIETFLPVDVSRGDLSWAEKHDVKKEGGICYIGNADKNEWKVDEKVMAYA